MLGKTIRGCLFFAPQVWGGVKDFMKRNWGGGLKAILTAEAGGAERFFGTEKNPFPGGFSGKFWSLP